jgi:hypothetical protein
VRLGEHQLSSSTETSLTTAHDVAAIVAHPDYDQPKNDVALLKLSTKVDTKIYTPVCLPNQGMDFTGLTATVIGYVSKIQVQKKYTHNHVSRWGKITAGKEGRVASSDILLEVLDLPIISDSDCIASGVEAEWKITSDMLCAGGQVGKDACKVRIIGATSSTFSCLGRLWWASDGLHILIM